MPLRYVVRNPTIRWASQRDLVTGLIQPSCSAFDSRSMDIDERVWARQPHACLPGMSQAYQLAHGRHPRPPCSGFSRRGLGLISFKIRPPEGRTPADVA